MKQIIEAGLELNFTEGPARAWVFLTHHHIPSETVARILAAAAPQPQLTSQPD